MSTVITRDGLAIASVVHGGDLAWFHSNVGYSMDHALTHEGYDVVEHATMVASYPDCDFCGRQARYDAKTSAGPWGNLCANHYRTHGVGLGLGKGQRLVASTEPTIVEVDGTVVAVTRHVSLDN
jgi:hypothetical protein